jgi:hypothetical protein
MQIRRPDARRVHARLLLYGVTRFRARRGWCVCSSALGLRSSSEALYDGNPVTAARLNRPATARPWRHLPAWG